MKGFVQELSIHNMTIQKKEHVGESELDIAILETNKTFTDAENALESYRSLGGQTTSPEYGDVVDAMNDLLLLLEAEPLSSSDIRSATVILKQATNELLEAIRRLEDE